MTSTLIVLATTCPHCVCSVMCDKWHSLIGSLGISVITDTQSINQLLACHVQIVASCQTTVELHQGLANTFYAQRYFTSPSGEPRKGRATDHHNALKLTNLQYQLDGSLASSLVHTCSQALSPIVNGLLGLMIHQLFRLRASHAITQLGVTILDPSRGLPSGLYPDVNSSLVG